MIIDGMTVQSAFFSGPPGVATRSRFMPFAFKGFRFRPADILHVMVKRFLQYWN
jgi:hypothetical protein